MLFNHQLCSSIFFRIIPANPFPSKLALQIVSRIRKRDKRFLDTDPSIGIWCSLRLMPAACIFWQRSKYHRQAQTNLDVSYPCRCN